ncbi:MAG TPA: radical SAM protein [bacterium]|nr:radical SAM protein [bacterium]
MPSDPTQPTVAARSWRDWRWQLRHRVTTPEQLSAFLPGLTAAEQRDCTAYADRFHFAITPYTLALVERTARGGPRPDDPVWRQYRFLRPAEWAGDFHYDRRHENWECAPEFPTRILQHKYPGRAIIRLTASCFAQCNYCYLTARVIDRSAPADRRGSRADWPATLRYLRAHREVSDVLLSGGEPLLLDNDRLARILHELRAIPSVRTIRLNTRVLTANPFRLDAGLARLLARYRVTALEIHLAHPRELTPDADAALDRLDAAGHRPLILWRSPLLRGINDRVPILEKLLLALYARRITPYYLFHYAPYTLGREVLGVGIRRGAAILRELRRRVPGPAFPRYTLFHPGGKHDIPLAASGTDEFQYYCDRHGRPMVRFRNWRGRWVRYPDVTE